MQRLGIYLKKSPTASGRVPVRAQRVSRDKESIWKKEGGRVLVARFVCCMRPKSLYQPQDMQARCVRVRAFSGPFYEQACGHCLMHVDH